jgi:YHS domain-containing protein
MRTSTVGLFVILLFGSLATAAGQENQPEQESPPRQQQQIEKSEDPVCHMMVRRDPDLATEYEGQLYYFCMKRDLEAFQKDPEKYLQGERHDHPDPGATAPDDDE